MAPSKKSQPKRGAEMERAIQLVSNGILHMAHNMTEGSLDFTQDVTIQAGQIYDDLFEMVENSQAAEDFINRSIEAEQAFEEGLREGRLEGGEEGEKRVFEEGLLEGRREGREEGKEAAEKIIREQYWVGGLVTALVMIVVVVFTRVSKSACACP
ncbi:uncharacterized protein RCC_09459 [Ramularia collo-cygni]|uniref:Essential protein Yae1 N-terminal domain-containing protein n=1 Tax=Ramularia collo-cygni TaxID=112498 RepID=A0A2D3VDB4_9PEZI|nr:uncharacterized protein RCC_09459 [Ramularia collo-cygni]CZT23745.1 uncharacterized protein RCC_09459 [Ramularia collo-cygni]